MFAIDDPNQAPKVQSMVKRLKSRTIKTKEVFYKKNKYKKDDVGLRNYSGSFLKIDENGDIEIFNNDYTSGMFINNEFNSLSLYGEDLINLDTPQLNILTSQSGISINHHTINPRLWLLTGNKNPKLYNKNASRILTGRSYIDDLRLQATVRWRCSGNSACGNKEKHSSHWVYKSINIKPFSYNKNDNYDSLIESLGR